MRRRGRIAGADSLLAADPRRQSRPRLGRDAAGPARARLCRGAPACRRKLSPSARRRGPRRKLIWADVCWIEPGGCRASLPCRIAHGVLPAYFTMFAGGRGRRARLPSLLDSARSQASGFFLRRGHADRSNFAHRAGEICSRAGGPAPRPIGRSLAPGRRTAACDRRPYRSSASAFAIRQSYSRIARPLVRVTTCRFISEKPAAS